ncbi:MAG: hypothetical protein CVU44_19370 [Chloroflexi bacterium HGW-Chloroflexi-6]|nr:MAG: hypothetical protein CVU44_19370 [Chloroflexi bacterium HGW-Chloroflexi-6]
MPGFFLGLQLYLLYGKINRMSPQRWVFFAFSILAGLGLGLLYGWVISPLEYVDTSPDSLRADYRADYVLMVAELYQGEQDAALASRRLTLLGSALPPAEIVAQALQFAESHEYAAQDVTLLQNLVIALQIYDASGALP